MKYLIVLALVALLVWKWRAARPKDKLPQSTTRRAKGEPAEGTPMLACRLCGVHVPQPEAVRSAQGWYCCEAHRHSAEA